MEKAYLITQNTDLEKDFSEYDRLYIWDQYCEHNMFYFFDDKVFLENIIDLNKKITITTPVISEKWLIKFFSFLNDFINNITDLEIVINDLWVFHKLRKKYPQIKLVWWNFLSWQNKDPYLKVFNENVEHKNLTIDSSYYENLLNKEKIENIELYNVFQWINVNHNFNINLYYPFIVYSINRHCPNAIIKEKLDYVKIVEDCSWCKDLAKNDLNMQLKIGNELVTQYYRWNKQFYKNDNLIEIKNIKRIIYNYDLIW